MLLYIVSCEIYTENHKIKSRILSITPESAFALMYFINIVLCKMFQLNIFY